VFELGISFADYRYGYCPSFQGSS